MNKAEEIIKKLIDSGKINGEEAIILIKAIQMTQDPLYKGM